MDKLLGYLAQFSSLSKQGELLCTQALAYLLRDAEAERVFTEWIGSSTGRVVSSGLSWHAESRQDDRARPDLEGRAPDGRAVVKLEAKLGAPFGAGQLESYVSALCSRVDRGTFLIVVPKSRLQEVTAHVNRHFGMDGEGPWRLERDLAEIQCGVVTWEDLLDTLGLVPSPAVGEDLRQFRSMYRVLNGDTMEPLTSDEDILGWRDRREWWERLVERASRVLTSPAVRLAPFGEEPGAQRYWRRYVCRPVAGSESCYSLGIRDPFQGHQTPVWLRFHRLTAHFALIRSRLARSGSWSSVVESQGHLWFPLQVPINADADRMVRTLVEQVQPILLVAYSE